MYRKTKLLTSLTLMAIVAVAISTVYFFSSSNSYQTTQANEICEGTNLSVSGSNACIGSTPPFNYDGYLYLIVSASGLGIIIVFDGFYFLNSRKKSVKKK